MGLFSWLTGRDEPASNSNTQPQVDERYEAMCKTPTAYRNCMNCANLDFDGTNYVCGTDMKFLHTTDRNLIANANCEYGCWEPRKHEGSYKKYIFQPDEWYKEY